MEPVKKYKVFLSYCWEDDKIADEISEHFKSNKQIELHRDIIDIKKWESIKEYMQSIGYADYVVLLISDNYLKSENCMYEVLEVIKDRNYKNKIFPVIMNQAVYKPINRSYYVRYWEKEFEQLKNALQGISIQNLGKLNNDLRKFQEISSNIAEFLDAISDMNNPQIDNVADSIEKKLLLKGIIENKMEKIPSDFQVNQFMKESFCNIVDLFYEQCNQWERKCQGLRIEHEHIDNRTEIYRFYKKEQLANEIKLFLRNMNALLY